MQPLFEENLKDHCTTFFRSIKKKSKRQIVHSNLSPTSVQFTCGEDFSQIYLQLSYVVQRGLR